MKGCSARPSRRHVEETYAFRFDGHHVLAAWAIRLSEWNNERFHSRSDGLTTYQRLHGVQYMGMVARFGETVLGFSPDPMLRSKLRGGSRVCGWGCKPIHKKCRAQAAPTHPWHNPHPHRNPSADFVIPSSPHPMAHTQHSLYDGRVRVD